MLILQAFSYCPQKQITHWNKQNQIKTQSVIIFLCFLKKAQWPDLKPNFLSVNSQCTCFCYVNEINPSEYNLITLLYFF